MRDAVALARWWSQGPGRQSGLWMLNALVFVGLPFLAVFQPACDAASCSSLWARLFFLPNMLFVPAILATLLLGGSWIAQRRHARFEARYYSELPASYTSDIPPGHLRPAELEDDLIRRTLRAWRNAALLGTVGFIGVSLSSLGRRNCDLKSFDGGAMDAGLPVCQDAFQWTDFLLAFEVWVFIAAAAVAAFWFGFTLFRLTRGEQGAQQATPAPLK